MRAEIFEYSRWLSPKPEDEAFRQTLETYLELSGFKALQFLEHHFIPMGYTALWLIGESHLALHTFPEEDTVYIQLSSCNREKLERFTQLIQTNYATQVKAFSMTEQLRK